MELNQSTSLCDPIAFIVSLGKLTYNIVCETAKASGLGLRYLLDSDSNSELYLPGKSIPAFAKRLLSSTDAIRSVQWYNCCNRVLRS